jgi:hypothetical protein
VTIALIVMGVLIIAMYVYVALAEAGIEVRV